MRSLNHFLKHILFSKKKQQEPSKKYNLFDIKNKTITVIRNFLVILTFLFLCVFLYLNTWLSNFYSVFLFEMKIMFCIFNWWKFKSTYFLLRLPQRTLESKHNGWRYIVLLNIPSCPQGVSLKLYDWIVSKISCFHSSIPAAIYYL